MAYNLGEYSVSFDIYIYFFKETAVLDFTRLHFCYPSTTSLHIFFLVLAASQQLPVYLGIQTVCPLQ